eukprot:32813_1
MSSFPGIVRQDPLLKAEYIFHGKTRSFSRFLSQIDNIHSLNNLTAIADPNQSADVSITIDYRMQRDNGRWVYGIIQPIKQSNGHKAWTLVCFTTEGVVRIDANSQSKSQRKKQKLSDERSCEPKPRRSAKGILRISREMTTEIIPKRVIQCNQMKPKMIYELMSKGIALMTRSVYIRNNIWALNFDFRDHTGSILYCLADKVVQDDEGRGYEWKLRDDLFTADQIRAVTGVTVHELVTTIRHTKPFVSQLERVRTCVRTMENMWNNLNDRQQQKQLKHVFHDKRDWQHIPVIINDDGHEVNKTQRKCTKTKHVFIKDCITFIANATVPIKVVPILFFNHITGGIDIDAGLRLCIEDCDMVITFKAPHLLPTAIILDVARVALMHHLVDGGASKTTFLDSWKSPFNDFAIGNRKDDENIYKAKSKECARYKQSHDALKVLIRDLKPVLKAHPTLAHSVRRAETVLGIVNVDQEEEKCQANRPNLLHRSEMVPLIAPMSLSYSIPPPMPPLYLPMSMPLIYNVQYVSFPLLGSIAPLPPMFMFPMTLYPMQTTPVVAMGNPPMINTPNPQASASIPIQNALDPRYGCK